MWELIKVYYNVKNMFNMSADSISLYFELLRKVDEFSNIVLVIFENKNALDQCYYRSKGNSSAYEKNDNKNILVIDDVEYEFVTIEQIYKTNYLNEKRFSKIEFKEAYSRVGGKNEIK